MSPNLAESSVKSYDLSAFQPALPELLAERAQDFYGDSPVERRIYLDIMLDILGSKRAADVEWRDTLEADQWQDAISGKALRIKYSFDKMRDGLHG